MAKQINLPGSRPANPAEFQGGQPLLNGLPNTYIDLSLIGRAFFSYKSQDRPKVIEYLQEAQAINHYRLAIQTRLENWESQEQNSKQGSK